MALTSNQGLSVSDVVNVEVLMTPVAAPTRNFGALLILGDAIGVIDVQERYRLYTSLASVAADFGSVAPEYVAAALFFAQSPQPQQVYIGRWASGPTRAVLRGGPMSAQAQQVSNFNSISSGGFTITIDGVIRNVTGLNFTGAANLPAVATIIQTALATAGTVQWDAANARFNVYSASSGTTSNISFATAPSSGTDVSGRLYLNPGAGGYAVAGANIETLLTAVTTLAAMTNDWYGLMVATSAAPGISDFLDVAGFIEGASPSHIYGLQAGPGAIDPTNTGDTASRLMNGNYNRTFTQYGSVTQAVVASMFGRALTVDFEGNNTTITLMFKQEPGVQAETLTETQAQTLLSKNCNVFINYNNSTAIIQPGVMASGMYIDEIVGTDWLQNDLQTAVYNLLYTSPTKVPQTDAGVNQIVAVICGRLDQAVANGLLAPGVWTGPALGAISTGDMLTKGYYVYAPPVSTQSQADRAARKAPVIQAACKLAGAVHSANIIVSVNR